MWRLILSRFLMVFAVAMMAVSSVAQPVTLFDFTQGDGGWIGNARVADFKATPEGLSFRCVGEDPWIEGPAPAAMPVGRKMLLMIRMKSNADKVVEIFYGPRFRGGKSVSFNVNNDGQWHDYEILMPVQEKGSRLRIDPAMEHGEITVAWIKAEVFNPIGTVELSTPIAPLAIESDFRVGSDDLSIVHYGRHWNDFAAICDGKTMAVANPSERLGIVVDGHIQYIALQDKPVKVTRVPENSALMVINECRFEDAHGAHWWLKRTFESAQFCADKGYIGIVTSIQVDRDTDVCHLPWLTLFPGLGSYGECKTQALLPGVEYLADEVSSSEADLRGEQAIRRIVDDTKLTMTMMTMVTEGHYMAMMWDRADHPAPVFDSPDRLFGSGAHVMGLWWPRVGDARLENSLEILKPTTLQAGVEYRLGVTLVGGVGESVVPAVRRYVEMRDLPPVPEYEGGYEAAMRLLAHGWTDSKAHQDGKWRHAVWGTSFQSQPAADALVYMQWLKDHLKSEDAKEALDGKLSQTITRGRQQLLAGSTLLGGVSHVQRPLGPLVFGDFSSVWRAMRQMQAEAKQNLSRFDEQGLVHYKATPGKPDYGSTHFADHANGLSAQSLEQILMAATFTGDADLKSRGLDLLAKQTTLYANTVPRGAQTWEMPLHTPDILASARMVRCYVLAYQLTGEPDWLEAARYWAWTGVSFLYLDAPTDGPVGPYATIAVLGATNWQAPNWIGRPVQWCGLVYRSALLDLARVDEEGGKRWRKLADGMTAAGLQMSFPLDDADRQGLLPDYFFLPPQVSDGPAINPGTVQAGLPELYGKGTMYDLARLPGGLLAHAPGLISDIQTGQDEVSFNVDGWPEGAYRIHLAGEKLPAQVKWQNEAGLHDAKTMSMSGARTKTPITMHGLTAEVSGKGRLILRMK